MSIEAVAWALRQPVEDPYAKLLLIGLADHHNASTGRCDPRRAVLSAIAVCGDSTTKRKIQLLIDAGLISVIPQHDPSGRQTTNSYQLHLPGGQADPLPPKTQGGGGHSSEPPEGFTAAPPRTVIGTIKKEGACEAPPVDKSPNPPSDRCSRTLNLPYTDGVQAPPPRTYRESGFTDDAVKLTPEQRADRIAQLRAAARSIHPFGGSKPSKRASRLARLGKGLSNEK